MALEQRQTLLLIQTQHLIRLHQVPLDITAGLGIGPGAVIDGRKQRLHGHLVIGNSNSDLAALFRDVLGGGQVVAAHIDGLVKGVELIFPFFSGIPLLPLAKALYHHLTRDIEAAHTVQRVGNTLHVSDVAVFVQTEVYQYRQPPALAVEPCVVGKLWHSQGKE